MCMWVFIGRTSWICGKSVPLHSLSARSDRLERAESKNVGRYPAMPYSWYKHTFWRLQPLLPTSGFFAKFCPAYSWALLFSFLHFSIPSFYLILRAQLKVPSEGCLGGSVVGHLPLAQVVIPGFWDQVPHRAPCREPASPSAGVASLPISVSLSWIKKKKERKKICIYRAGLWMTKFFYFGDIAGD